MTRLISRQSLYVMALRGVDIIVAALSLRLMTEILAPSEYAAVILFQTIVQGWVWFTVSPLQNYMFRRVATEEESQLPRAVGQASAIAAFSSLSALPFAYAIHELSLIPLEGPTPQIAALIVLGIFGSALSSFVVPLLNFGGRPMAYGLYQLALTIAGVAMAVAVAYILGSGAGGWVLGMAVGQVMISAVLIVSLGLRANSIRAAAKRLMLEKQQIKRFALPLLASIPLQWYFVQGFRFNLEGILGLETFGFFMVGFFLPGKFFNAVEKVINVGFQPGIFAATNRDIRARAWMKFALTMTATGVLLGSALWFLEAPVFFIFVAQEYDTAKIFFGLGIISEALRVGTNTILTFLLATQQTKLILVTTAATSVCLAIALTSGIANDALTIGKILIALNLLAVVLAALGGIWTHWTGRDER